MGLFLLLMSETVGVIGVGWLWDSLIRGGWWVGCGDLGKVGRGMAVGD